ncbi:MAG: twin-arginine translocase TatA/TatE family subunit [Porphyromonas sp.]|nr:twin-arginine translocase TatA/TatE family subunit [Porphyromonas sp.]
MEYIQLLFLPRLGMGELLVILLVILLLFGAKRIPELMRSFGKGIKSFKDGLNEDDNVGGKEDDTSKE